MSIRLSRVAALLAAVAIVSCSKQQTSYEDVMEAEKLLRAGMQVFAQDRNIDSALTLFQRASRHDPTNAEAYYRAAMMHEYAGDFAAAMAAYEKCLEHDQSRPEVHLNLGQLYGRAGRYDDAMREFGTSIEMSDDVQLTAMAQYCVGLTWGIQGNSDKAVDAFVEAADTDSTFIAAYIGQAQELLRANRAEEAVPVLQRVIDEFDPSPTPYSMLAQAYRATGRMDEAQAMEEIAHEMQHQMEERLGLPEGHTHEDGQSHAHSH